MKGKPSYKGQGRPRRFDQSAQDVKWAAVDRWMEENIELIDEDWWKSLFDTYRHPGDLMEFLEQVVIIETEITFREMVDHYEKVLTSPTAKFELPE